MRKKHEGGNGKIDYGDTQLQRWGAEPPKCLSDVGLTFRIE